MPKKLKRGIFLCLCLLVLACTLSGCYIQSNGMQLHIFSDPIENVDQKCDELHYYRFCFLCGCIKKPKNPFGHHDYIDIHNHSHHATGCKNCSVLIGYGWHSQDQNGMCKTCKQVLTPTPGITYKESPDKTYARVYFYPGQEETVIIAPTYNGLPVKEIGGSAFKNNKSIKAVIIPETVTTVASSAFYNCENLSVINFPDSITSIGSSAFANCESLTSIRIGNGVTSIGSRAFESCDLLETVTI